MDYSIAGILGSIVGNVLAFLAFPLVYKFHCWIHRG